VDNKQLNTQTSATVYGGINVFLNSVNQCIHVTFVGFMRIVCFNNF